jgi:hypothetical protein
MIHPFSSPYNMNFLKLDLLSITGILIHSYHLLSPATLHVVTITFHNWISYTFLSPILFANSFLLFIWHFDRPLKVRENS